MLGGAGEDFGRGGSGEEFGATTEVDAVVKVRPVRARLPQRRAVRARVGVLEDVRGPAGSG